MTNPKYRPEIDGLRAIAVISVLVFHSFADILPGGFVGVDIFFVISGYLITQIIFQELQIGNFSLWSFYQRRIRRIFPALLLVFLTCTILGWVILTPFEYELYGTHMLAGAGFVPNIIFWREAGYFDKEAITKPLLHLWSLGVEEQFYFAWPLILGIAWKFCKPHRQSVFNIVVVLVFISLVWSGYQIGHHPVANFYSPLSRFWELALGGSIAIWISRPEYVKLESQWLGLMGFGLIAFALFGFDSNTPFPGLWALIPCLGAGLILLANIKSSPLNLVLNHPAMVFIGLISYPLYLWHWPLLSFARILEGQTISDMQKLVLLGLSGVLAWLTFQIVEKPIRASRSPKTAVVLLLCMLLALSFGVVLRKKDGFKHRHEHVLSANPNTMVVGEFRNEMLRPCELSLPISPDLDCFADKREPIKFAILGDSKAEALYYGLTSVSSEKGHWLLVDGIHPTPIGAGADPRIQQVFESVSKTPHIEVVAIANTVSSLFPLDKHTGLITSESPDPFSQLDIWSKQITALENAGKKVIVIIDNPTFPDPTSCIEGGLTSSSFFNQVFTRRANPYCSIAYDQFLNGMQPYKEWLKSLQKLHPNLIIFDTSPYLCDVKNNMCTITEGSNFIYSYSNHISDYAAKKIGVALTPIVDNLLKK
ncbi:hypothetical protein PSHI8_02040 [Polynucleobacter sp. SHI8]|uniref:acyltransferase family protein n=1 Tax=unclassified Polynucleobacter TaxID=2640945 RepID=UPI002490924A|nr:MULTISPECIES: acyltransferase family protein [unclassified Polynucleobacter]BDW10122.1 hypothetical protein PSHI2_02040 [Polynucleobacter sp. SHI2]BDW12568.1 hypothetical protein PSHI8_02040 [Polynucleobacter sp. SHI8]